MNVPGGSFQQLITMISGDTHHQEDHLCPAIKISFLAYVMLAIIMVTKLQTIEHILDREMNGEEIDMKTPNTKQKKTMSEGHNWSLVETKIDLEY